MKYTVNVVTSWGKTQEGFLINPKLGKLLGTSKTHEGARRIIQKHKRKFPHCREMRITFHPGI